ncbi:Adiponectin receptor protein 1 [Ranunculus cassubicifolius]
MNEMNNHHCSNNCKAETQKGEYKLVSYQELPNYMKDNEYIRDYYRANWPLKVAFFSLFRWHNETLNVWTHLIGFVMFFWLTLSNLMHSSPQLADLISIFFTSAYSESPAANVSHSSNDFSFGGTAAWMNITQPADSMFTGTSRWPFFVFLAGSMFCLLSSSTCHLFCCHSHRVNILLLRFDYVGIAVMIVTSFFPPIYYIFQCEPVWQFVYLSGITTMGICTVYTLLSPLLSTKEYRRFRALLFFSMGFSGIVPAIHALIVNWNEPRRFVTLAYESAMALSYAIGTLFYVTRIPERWRPGWFDLAGHSHQIFHIFVILGALSHYGAALVFIDWRDTVGCTI